MAIIISRTFQGRPIRKEEMQRIMLNQNTEIDHILNRVLLRMNRENEERSREEVQGRQTEKRTNGNGAEGLI